MGSVDQWARAENAQRILLWVTEGNESARRLYRRHGYDITGKRKALPSNPALHEEEMVLHLGTVRR